MSNLITIVTTNINDSAISLNFFYSTIDSCFSKASVTDRSTAVHLLLHLRAHAIYTNDESRSWARGRGRGVCLPCRHFFLLHKFFFTKKCSGPTGWSVYYSPFLLLLTHYAMTFSSFVFVALRRFLYPGDYLYNVASGKSTFTTLLTDCIFFSS